MGKEKQPSYKHAQVPNGVDADKLKFGDKYVYAHLRKHANKGLKSFPGYELLTKESGLSERSLKRIVLRLEEAGLIKIVNREGTSNEYHFKKLEDGFERFTDKFLEDSSLSVQARAYYVELQQYLYVNENNRTNDTTYTNQEIADKLGINVKTVRKYNTELIQKGVLREVRLTTVSEAGIPLTKKEFDLDKLNQAILYKLKEHSEKLSEHDQAIRDLEVENEDLRSRVAALERLAGLKANTYLHAKDYKFD